MQRRFRKIICAAAILGFASVAALSQNTPTPVIPLTRSCGTMPRYTAQLKNPEFLLLRKNLFALTTAYAAVNRSARFVPRTTLIRVPVVVHVLYSSDADNISDEQVSSQITALNRDYQNKSVDISAIPNAFRASVGNPLLEFDLAAVDPSGKATTGVTRTKTDTTTFLSDGPSGDNAKSQAAGGFDAWPSDQYLNIWVVGSLQDYTGRQLLGYSSFPGELAAKDGVVIRATAFGTEGSVVAPFDKGKTATHEIGHWLNLFHIWGDDETAADVCSGSDQVDDTPNQALPNYGCPPYPHNSCKNASLGGDMFMDYMDYTDDGCMQFFTVGQVLRMEATLSGFRANISKSLGLPRTAP